MTERFPTPSWIVVDLKIPAGTVELEAVETIETEVEVEALNAPARERLDKLVVSLEGDHLRVEAPEKNTWVDRTPEYAVRVRCPLGSKVKLRSASTDLAARGRLGSLEVKTASGDVAAEDVDGPVRVDSASGDVRVRSAGADVELRTASGDLEVARAHGRVKAQSVSGDVEVGEAAAAVEVQTVSGDLRVERVDLGPLSVNAVSGDVDVAIAPGAAVWLDLRSLSGEMRSELDAGEAPGDGEHVVEVRGKTVSGDVRIRRAVV
ncbi:MAG: DUF4097 family beta strand repeat-containing protein [Pseudomonadota bacterium]